VFIIVKYLPVLAMSTISIVFPHGIFIYLFSLVLAIMPAAVNATHLSGIDIPEHIEIAPHLKLRLNGAGIRTKFIYDIYVAALYLEQTTSDRNEILQATGAKRIALHFVYGEVRAEKLVEGWNDGFRLNNNHVQLGRLQQRLDRSIAYFETMHSGDTIYLDYLPDIGTRLSVNGNIKGIIEGDDFFQAALKVWIGEYPAQEQLKNNLLGL
jgi:hypothetical protein